MKKCFIIGASRCGSLYHGIETGEDDLVIAADGGYIRCMEAGIKPDMAVGDWDSAGNPPHDCLFVQLPVEKDDTDTLAAIKLGIEKGFDEFHIFFGTGGRPDHTIANMQCLVFLSKKGKRGYLYDEEEIITAITNSSITFSAAAKGSISVFSADGTAYGVTETGLKYSLDNAVVTSDFPIGVSNSFAGVQSNITVENGTLYIIFPKGEFPL